jgi:hypothetical protein
MPPNTLRQVKRHVRCGHSLLGRGSATREFAAFEPSASIAAGKPDLPVWATVPRPRLRSLDEAGVRARVGIRACQLGSSCDRHIRARNAGRGASLTERCGRVGELGRTRAAHLRGAANVRDRAYQAAGDRWGRRSSCRAGGSAPSSSGAERSRVGIRSAGPGVRPRAETVTRVPQHGKQPVTSDAQRADVTLSIRTSEALQSGSDADALADNRSGRRRRRDSQLRPCLRR